MNPATLQLDAGARLDWVDGPVPLLRFTHADAANPMPEPDA
jgi:hypothetical protein